MKIRLHVQDGIKSFDFEHAGPAIAIGRNPAGEVVLEEEGTDSVVSWEHARIELSPREATLTDLRSTNGTYRNGQAVQGTIPLWPNDTIRFGQTGPVLTVQVIDLIPVASPPANFRVSSSPPPLPAAGKRMSAAAAVAETRVVAVKPVRPLPTRVDSPREQQRSQSLQSHTTTVLAISALAICLLLGAGLVIYSGKVNLLGQRVDESEASLKKFGEDMRGQAESTAEHFGNIDRDMTEKRERQQETLTNIDRVAQQSIAQEARLHGGMDQLKKDLGASLDELNRRMTPLPPPQPAEPPTPTASTPPPTPSRSTSSPRVEPGMKMDVVHRNGSYYTGVLLGINATEVSLQTNPHEGAKPSKFDIRDVQAFQTRDGIFAFDEATRDFGPAVTYYRFHKTSGVGEFERMESQSQAAYLIEDAQVLGPTNSAKALLGRGQAGEWCVGLPIPLSRSPNSIPAYHFKEIITSKGVYTYDNATHEFTYKPHTQLAAEAKAATDEYWRKVDEKIYARRVESYQLGTERVRALGPYYGRTWWWW